MYHGGVWHFLQVQEIAAERAQRALADQGQAALAASEQRLQQQLEQAQADHQAERREAEEQVRALQGEGPCRSMLVILALS